MSFKIRSADKYARTGTIRTKHGDLKTPTIFPVHNLGADAGWNTPAYWKMFPEINTGMFNAAYLHMDKRNQLPAILEKGVHRYTDFSGVAFLDSGGYIYRKYGLDVTQREIFDLQIRSGADIASTLDYPFLLSDTPADRKIADSMKNAQEALPLERKGTLLYVSVHGYDPLILGNGIRYLSKLGDFDGIAIGSLMLSFASFDLLVDLVLAAKRARPDLPVHVYGLGGPLVSTLLAYLGVDSVDSAMFVINAGKRQYFLPSLKRISMSSMKGETLPCDCAICSSHSVVEMIDNRELLSFHNLWICWSNMLEVRSAIVEQRMEKYVETKFASAPWAKKAFKYAKQRMIMGPNLG